MILILAKQKTCSVYSVERDVVCGPINSQVNGIEEIITKYEVNLIVKQIILTFGKGKAWKNIHVDIGIIPFFSNFGFVP